MIDSIYFRKHMNGTSAMDYCDEYYWTGNYECIIGRPDLNHNYYIYISCNRRSRKNSQQLTYTAGWTAYVYQAMSCSNSRDITIGEFKSKTLKNVISQVVDCINQYDRDIYPVKMKKWMDLNRHPVFTIQNDGSIVILGTSYSSCGKEMKDSKCNEIKEKWLYYHDDLPDYNKYHNVMTLDKNPWGSDANKLYISYVYYFGCGYSMGGLREEDFIKKYHEMDMATTICKVQEAYISHRIAVEISMYSDSDMDNSYIKE